MGALQTTHTPELRGLYANSNRFTQPKGTVPRLSNLYLIRRGAFHTTPGTKWLSSYDGTAPHSTSQLALIHLNWYSPSVGSGPAVYMQAQSAVTANNFVLALQNTSTPGVALQNASSGAFYTLASQSGAVSQLSNSSQYGDYMVFALGKGIPPNIFPTFTVTSGSITNTATAFLSVQSTDPFPPEGYIYVASEIMHYTGLTQTAFTGLQRGAFGSPISSHPIGTNVTMSVGATAVPWAPITNTFDPSTAYSQWPGTTGGNASTSVAVNIGTVIYMVDAAGTAWLFRAQNSGVTGYGATYPGPQWWPLGLTGGGFGSDGTMNATSQILTVTQNEFTNDNLIGQQIVVEGAGASGDLVASILGFFDSNDAGLDIAASTSVSGAPYRIGVGHYGDSVRDYNPANKSGTIIWLNIGQAAISPPGAGFVFQHLNYLFLWGVGTTYGNDGISGPDALWQSSFGSPTNYNPQYTTFVGKGDGTQAQGGAVYSLSEAGIAATPQLVLFKDASTYSFLNAFPNESLVEVSGGLGCIAPNTIQFIGSYGVMRLSYAGVTLFDGQLEHVSEYTDAIRGYLFGGVPGIVPVDFNHIQNCTSSQAVNPPMYMFFAPLVGGSGNVTRGFGYDFGLKQWFVMDLPFPISSSAFLPQATVALANSYLSLIGGADDGTMRRIFAGDPDWDGVAVNWNVQLPDWGFPGTPVYIDRCNVRITPDGGGATPALTAPVFSGVLRSGVHRTETLRVPNSLINQMRVNRTVLSGNLTISGSGQVLIEGSDAQTSDKPMGRVGL